ncbi:methyl-accepting chemotaxis protein [Kosakonia cowanii]|jgi:methyl-accepting chemotaxis protein|uniref:methyl-accepting chemotaxis protein n=1 Tax=Kosakonia cowanii TaxID=208223 RepID=UPI0027310C8A|nr:methyl-accepting chemotaxis protein [Kosakonia cowanii]WKW40751.1 methyl-accepting chemotaxis protein [Kosakonia cowanii]
MSITQRLSLAFSLLALSLFAMVAVSLSVISGFQSRFEYVQVNAIPSIKDLNKSISTTSQLRIAFYRHQTASDSADQAADEKEINSLLNTLKSLTDYYMANDISSDKDKVMTEQAYRNIEAVRATLPAFLAASRNHDNALSLSLIRDEKGVGASVRKMESDFTDQIELNIKIGETLREQNKKIYAKTWWMMTSAAAVVILLLGLFSITIIRGIKRSLDNIKSTMAEVSNNLDLTRAATVFRNDEIGQTASAFNGLLEKVSTTLLSVNHAAQSVGTGSAQIAAGNEDLSSRTEEQAASLEQTSASMATLSETVRQNAEGAVQASELANNANNLSSVNAGAVSQMLETMSEIRGSSEKISEITGLIEGIAFQTNILALNAAVEAARAGEHGRGFAVVASEVRTLAQRSSSAAREIKDLILLSVFQVEQGLNQAKNVGSNTENVSNAVRQVTDLVNEIAAATTEQSKGIEQVHLAIGQMDEVTQQNASLVEEASSASKSLQEQAESLLRLVSTFMINENTEYVGRTASTQIGRTLQTKAASGSSAATHTDWESF